MRRCQGGARRVRSLLPRQLFRGIMSTLLTAQSPLCINSMIGALGGDEGHIHIMEVNTYSEALIPRVERAEYLRDFLNISTKKVTIQ